MSRVRVEVEYAAVAVAANGCVNEGMGGRVIKRQLFHAYTLMLAELNFASMGTQA